MSLPSTSSAPPPPVLSPEEEESLKAATFQRLHPRIYFERFAAEGIRPDGREFDEWRDVSVNVGSISTADGSALVRLGSTTVVCGVKAEIAEPDLERPGEGFLVPNLDLPALCSARFKPGPPSEEAQVLSERLNDVLQSIPIVPLTSLCIHPGKSVWVLYIDATCLNYDGNVFDATLIAMTAALKNTRLPEARYDVETGKTICKRWTPESQSRSTDKMPSVSDINSYSHESKRLGGPLQINRYPVPTSFGVFDSTHILSDPTSFEEPLLDILLSIVTDQNGELISFSQSGGVMSGELDVVSSCLKAAKSRCGHLVKELSIYDS